MAVHLSIMDNRRRSLVITQEPEIIYTELGGACPVQAEGTINGHPFYFRYRGDEWSLTIAPKNGDPMDIDHAVYYRSRHDHTGEIFNGWMEDDEVREIISACAREWMEGGRGSKRPSEESEDERMARFEHDLQRMKEEMARLQVEFPELRLTSTED
jgi:hypothetical protein